MPLLPSTRMRTGTGFFSGVSPLTAATARTAMSAADVATAQAILVDRSALKDPLGLAVGQAGMPGEPLAHRVVAGEFIFAAPAVEPEALRSPVLA